MTTSSTPRSVWPEANAIAARGTARGTARGITAKGITARATARATAIAIGLLATIAAGCGTAEQAFIDRRAHSPCIQAIPACPAVAASCVLDAEQYTDATFPGASPMRFLVDADAGQRLTLNLFFKAQVAPGSDTRVLWHAPGCVDTETYASQGRDLFSETRTNEVLTRAHTVTRTGEQLVEILSDMQAQLLITIDVE